MMITQEMWVQILQLLVAIFTIVKVYVVNKKVTETKVELQTVKTEINGHMTTLLEKNKAASKAEGNIEGRKELKEEQHIEGGLASKMIDESTERIIGELKKNAMGKDVSKSAKILIAEAENAARKLIDAAKIAADKLVVEGIQEVKIVQSEGEAVNVKQETPIPVEVIKPPKS